jgi:hypothetical protein
MPYPGLGGRGFERDPHFTGRTTFKTCANTNTNTNTDTDADANPDTDADANANANANPDTDADANANANPDTHACPESGIETIVAAACPSDR